MKFHPGDPVWVRSLGPQAYDQVPAGEHAGVVVEFAFIHSAVTGLPAYITDCIHLGVIAAVTEPRLRPRRDDYQQHEPLGSRKDLDKPIHEPNDFSTETLTVEVEYPGIQR